MFSRFLPGVFATLALLSAVPARSPEFEVSPQHLYGLVAEPNCSNAAPHCNADPANTSVDPTLVARVTTSIDAYWQQAFSLHHASYTSPKIVSYVGAVEPLSTGCGIASAEPAFYCARDRTIYLDTSLLAQSPFQGSEITLAVAIAHEWTHHVQTLLGLRRSLTPGQASEFLPEYLELQADCGAGAWAWSASTSHQTDAWDAPLAIAFFGTIGDPASPANAADAHGSNLQRTAAFEAGFTKGGYAADCKLPLS